MTPQDISRRRALAQFCALAAVPMASFSPLALAQTQAPLTVGFIHVGAKDDYGYNQAHAEAVAEIRKIAGIKAVEDENVAETQAVQKTMQGMISQDGATLLFPTSFGYFDPHMLAVAAKNPNVRFAHCGGMWTEGKHPKNTGSFDIFAGEMKDNTGKVVIPKGKVYKQTDADLEGMGYLIEGVVGKIWVLGRRQHTIDRRAALEKQSVPHCENSPKLSFLRERWVPPRACRRVDRLRSARPARRAGRGRRLGAHEHSNSRSAGIV